MPFAIVILAIILIISAFTDLRYHKVYNFITVPGMILGLGLNGITYGWTGLANSAIGLLFGFVILFIVFIFGGMGGGDVKLMGAVGALMGFPFIFWAVCYTGLVGGIMALSVMIWKGVLWQSLKRIGRSFITLLLPWLVMEPLKKEHSYKVPYGLAIGIGTFWALLMERLV